MRGRPSCRPAAFPAGKEKAPRREGRRGANGRLGWGAGIGARLDLNGDETALFRRADGLPAGPLAGSRIGEGLKAPSSPLAISPFVCRAAGFLSAKPHVHGSPKDKDHKSRWRDGRFALACRRSAPGPSTYVRIANLSSEVSLIPTETTKLICYEIDRWRWRVRITIEDANVFFQNIGRAGRNHARSIGTLFCQKRETFDRCD